MTASDPFAAPDFSDLAAVAGALLERCPDAAPVAPLQVRGEGFFSLAVSTPSGALFRLATAPQVFERYAREQRVVHWLSGQRLPLALPAHRWPLPPDAALPFGAVGYPLLAGRTLQRADVDGTMRAELAQQLAAFAFALHACSVPHAQALGVPDGRSYNRGWYESDRALSDRALAPLLTAAERAHVSRFWDGFMSAFDARDYEPVVTHGDIGDDNLIVDPASGLLTAVVDWEHCAICDPLDDLRNLQHFDRDFFRQTAERYEQLGGKLGDGLEARLDWHFGHDPFPGIRRAFQRGDALDAGAIRAKLRKHGVLP